MIEGVQTIAEWCAGVTELTGVFLITGLVLLALASAALETLRHTPTHHVFKQTRLRVGRGILLGLEFLVAADIIHTVAVELTFETVGVLAIVVLIRTFLSFTLTVELENRWPWQLGDQQPEGEHRGDP
ncbi:DUF1622 domain-containing protein [Botrimarina sp.]|uniref:DUF1622 domain-containing protein n=1 Tax=Botrimarina sp. TaxID=2795802 RepID=UPI0032EDCDC2